MNNTVAARTGSVSPTDKRAPIPLIPKGKLQLNERAAAVNKPYKAFMDPFAGAGAPVKLSPGAQAFSPNGAKPAPTPIRMLNRDSTADQQPTIVCSPAPPGAESKADDGLANGKGKASVQQPIGTRDGNISPPRPRVYFTTDVGPKVPFQGGHYVKIENITRADLAGRFKAMDDDFQWASKLIDSKAKPTEDGKTFIYFCAFNDLRQAEAAFNDVEMVNGDWPMNYITQTEFASAADGGNTDKLTSYHDGQVVFIVSFDGPTSDFNTDAARNIVHEFAKSKGDLRAFTELPARYPRLEFRAEFYEIGAAKSLLPENNRQGAHRQGQWLIVARELPNYTTGAAAVDGTSSIAAEFDGMAITETPHRQSGDGLEQFTSPTGRTAWRVDGSGNRLPSAPPRVLSKVGPVAFGQPMTSVVPGRSRNSAPAQTPSHHLMHGTETQPRSASWEGSPYPTDMIPRRSPVPAPQAVEIWKISNGQDVRTTVMLRNIPNRMDCRELKELLDETSKGCYDFSYLRIDFEKGTNVGYAFVNFVDPVDIIPFVERYQGARWLPSNPRLVELSYATVQGYDCLVEKFRNSAIMSEFSEYRPKLWYTVESAPDARLIGEEAPFPEPNNISKKQRSHDNAGQIGLYAPRSGYMSRDRGRRSQFDRGTPAQMQEDAGYDGYGPMPPATPYGHGFGFGLGGSMGPPSPYGPNIYSLPPYGHVAPGPYPGGMPSDYQAFMPPAFANGQYGHSNAYAGAFGTGPGTPASRLRTQTAGRLGGGPRQVHTLGGGMQSPGMQNMTAADERAAHVAAIDGAGYNNTPGPYAYPSGY